MDSQTIIKSLNLNVLDMSDYIFVIHNDQIAYTFDLSVSLFTEHENTFERTST